MLPKEVKGKLPPHNKFYTSPDSHRKYMVVAALRGPDFPAPCLKAIFTQRLRALVLPFFLPHLVRIDPTISLAPLQGALEETVKQCKHNPFGLYHYLTHILSALTILNEEGIIGEEEYNCLMWLANFLLRIREMYWFKFADETEINLMALAAEQYIKQFAKSKYVADGEAAVKAMSSVLKAAKRYALKKLKKRERKKQ